MKLLCWSPRHVACPGSSPGFALSKWKCLPLGQSSSGSPVALPGGKVLPDSVRLALSYVGHGLTFLLYCMPPSQILLHAMSQVIYKTAALWSCPSAPNKGRWALIPDRMVPMQLETVPGRAGGMLGFADVTGSQQFSSRSGWLWAGREPQIRLQLRWGHPCCVVWFCWVFFFWGGGGGRLFQKVYLNVWDQRANSHTNANL